MSNITIIDAGCGKGKTEYIIRFMNAHQERPYIYISPLKEMYARLDGKGEYAGRGTAQPFIEPTPNNVEGRRLQHIKELMKVGENIKSTHSLFLSFDQEATEIASAADYHLVIDEDLNAVTVLSDNGITGVDEDCSFDELERQFKRGDLPFLLKNGLITIDEGNYNRVNWVEHSGCEDHKFSGIKQIIETGSVSYINGSFIVWHFPVNVLQAFDDITVLTYRFRNSILRAYLDFYDLSYCHKTVVQDGNDFYLDVFNPSIESGAEYARLIHIFDEPKLNTIGIKMRGAKHNPQSSTWYKSVTKNSPEQLRSLKNHLTNYLRHKMNATPSDVMWTTFKKYQPKLNPPSFTQWDVFDENGNKRTEKTFVSCNCRATEKYADRHVTAYLVNKYLHPGIKNFFNLKGITIDEDEYALSELLQWLFRSAIRRGEEISLYMPCERMRRLLKRWLEEERLAQAS